MKRYLFLLILTIFTGAAVAQQLPDPSNFDNRTHDFGEIKEVDGPVIHEFLFTNEGDTPVRITNVKASCGCTTPAWSKDDIMPGESGFVQAQYNPRNRPGAFRKSLRVSTTAPENNETIFFITGTVISRPRTPADDFPVLLGEVRFKNRTVNLGRVTTEGPTTREFEVYNDGDAPISFHSAGTVVPPHIQIEFVTSSIEPKTKGQIKVTYDAVAKNDLGYVNDRITLQTDEDSAANKDLYVIASIVEYFGPLTPEVLANAPKLTLNKRDHDFGRIKMGTIISQEFVLTNTGASGLNIRKAKANCGCITYTLDKYDIEPNESATMVIEFDTKRRRGNQLQSINIFSNDPAQSAQVITMKGSVQQPSTP